MIAGDYIISVAATSVPKQCSTTLAGTDALVS